MKSNKKYKKSRMSEKPKFVKKKIIKTKRWRRWSKERINLHSHKLKDKQRWRQHCTPEGGIPKGCSSTKYKDYQDGVRGD